MSKLVQSKLVRHSGVHFPVPAGLDKMDSFNLVQARQAQQHDCLKGVAGAQLTNSSGILLNNIALYNFLCAEVARSHVLV
jgi:hypothetical protein